MKKYTIICLMAIAAIACSSKGGDKSKGDTAIDAEKIFKINCVLCHGEDGKLGLNNSKDLTVSKLTLDERIAMVTNGKNLMTGFGSILEKDEIKAVAEYTFKLK